MGPPLRTAESCRRECGAYASRRIAAGTAASLMLGKSFLGKELRLKLVFS